MYEKRSQRVILAYQAACAAVILMSAFWGAIFMYHGQWPLVGAEVVLAAVAGVTWYLIRSDRFNAALILSEVAFLIFATGFCLLFDVPNSENPRVSHLFLLVLALLGYINYLRGRSKFQLFVIAACLGGFVVFSSANLSFSFASPIPDDIRSSGTWINSFLATLMMCGCIYAIQLKFTHNRRMVAELRSAVRRNELELFFQPQIDRVGNIIGAEALLRWKHPQRGYVMPGDFIAVAEESGLMPLLGGWVLKEACRTLAVWSEDPILQKLALAVNVSASQFKVDDFERTVLDTVRLYGTDPARLKLELTESVIISGMAAVVAKMNALRDVGIMFALDDFGTGYSSLSYLRSLPIYQLKIDRSFVQSATENERGAALLKRIVQIGVDLGFVVLAEGVETTAQHAFLLNCGTHEFQGYHFGRPMPGDRFEEHVRHALAQAGREEEPSRSTTG